MFNNIYRGKKVLITGSTGFKGSWLSIWLSELGAEVHAIAKDIPTQPAMFEVLALDTKIHHQTADITHAQAMYEIIGQLKPDFVFHLAAQAIVSTSYNNPIETMMTNIMGTAHILEALRLSNHPCIAVMITSDKCYDNVEWVWGYKETDALGGKDPYSASKGGAELMIKTYYHSYFKKPESRVRVAAVRAGNVIGGGDWALNRIVPDCFRAWSAHTPVEIRNPQATRPWQHVLEPLSGYLRMGQCLAEKPALNGEAYNFGPNADQNFTVLELLKALQAYWTFADKDQAFNIHQNHSFHEAGLLKLNCDKALFDLQWKPTLNFEQTAAFTGTWYNRYYHQAGDMWAFTREQIAQYTQIATTKQIAWTH